MSLGAARSLSPQTAPRRLYPRDEYSSLMIKTVTLSKAVQKALKKRPAYVVVKLLGWVDLVENEGLENARRIPGYHDGPLWGQREGQRSIRLSRSWRAIYVVVKAKGEEKESFVEVTEVNKHDY